MPNLISSKKRAKQAIKRNQKNVSRNTALKTAIKKVMGALALNEIDNAKILLRSAESKIMRAKNKHLMHRNTAFRTIGRLAKRVAKVSVDKK